MDSEYLRAAVGSVLSKGIAETVVERPDDPIGYLAEYLLKSVADEKAEKVLVAEKKVAAEEAATAATAAAAAVAKEEEKAMAVSMQAEKEDKRLSNLLDNATSSDEVYMAVLSFARARTGASGYVMLTDIPEKIMPKIEPEAPPAEEPAEPAEGEEPPPPPEPEEPPEPRPPFKPTAMEYVAATSSDEALLIGKSIARPPAPSEDDPDAVVVSGVGEGVTFTAIDDYIAGGAKVFHEPAAVENRSVKFWYMPRLGAYAAAPFADYEGDVCGVLGFDTLGLERAFTADELAMLESLATRTGETLTRIQEGLAVKHHSMIDTLSAAYPKSEEGAYPMHTAEDGADPFDTAKAVVALPAVALATLTADALAHLSTRRTLPPAYLMTLKGVLALVSPVMASEMAEATWEGLKEAFGTGDLVWGDALFAALGSFDVMAGAGGEGWEVATAMATALTTPPEEGDVLTSTLPGADGSLLLGKVLCDWLLAVVALHTLKADKEAAEAAAAADAAAAEAGSEEVAVE